ncbi:nucleoside monophosphate kinase [Candidatus Peregrinibacteria bacterium]|nr:nucleoside monophosphate kinase [Candidatus Peregrinibacteria bacterium]
MDLVLFGIQGSGKGTQARRLASEFGYDIFEAGGELRKIAALAPRSPKGEEGSGREDSKIQLARTVKSYIDQGHLVPHEIIMQVVKEAIAARSPDQKILFDGIPRDLNQMKDFNAIMRDVGRDFRAVHLKLDPEEGLKRIFRRAQAQGRADDANEEIVRRRMQTFVEKTMPVIGRYKKEGKVTEIDGMGTEEKVYEQLKKALQ